MFLGICFRIGINFHERFEVPTLLRMKITAVQVITSCNLVYKQATTVSERNATPFFRMRLLLSVYIPSLLKDTASHFSHIKQQIR